MNKINNYLHTSQGLYCQVQAIAGEIVNSPITPRKYQVLADRLNNAFEALEYLETQNKTSNLFAKIQAEGLEKQCVELSKVLIDRLVEREIAQIQKESNALKNGAAAPSTIKELQAHIQSLEKNHALSIPERRIISEAKRVLMEVQGMKTLNPSNPIKVLNQMAENEILPGEIEELYDIAKAVYNHDLKQARMRYQMLSEEHKRLFQQHMRVLKAEPFKDDWETIQALMATVNELIENGELYPSLQEIKTFFSELSQLNEEERAEGKIFSFNPRSSCG